MLPEIGVEPISVGVDVCLTAQAVCEVRPASEGEKEWLAAPCDGWWALFPLVGFTGG
jgi:hypothetical protein